MRNCWESCLRLLRKPMRPNPAAWLPRPLPWVWEEPRSRVKLASPPIPRGRRIQGIGVCLGERVWLQQLRFHERNLEQHKNGIHNGNTAQLIADAIAVVDQHLRALQLKQYKEIGKALGRPIEAVTGALEFIKTLDPRPGLRYNKVQPRLIEPDVAFVKHGDEWLVVMNDDDLPTLRLNPAYRRLLSKDTNDKDTRNYVKERYKSAIQLIKNIEQRKQTIMKVCYAIVG